MVRNVLKFVVISTIFLVSTGFSQNTELKGKVVDNNNQAVQGAQVRLVKANRSQTTDWEGKFSIQIPLSKMISTGLVTDMITFQNGLLSLNLTRDQNLVQVEVFDLKGLKVSTLQKNISNTNAVECRILPDGVPVAVYIIKLRVGVNTGTFSVMNVHNQKYSLMIPELYYEQPYYRQADVNSSGAIDSLEIIKNNFQTMRVAVRSYNSDLGTITLKPNQANEEGLPVITNGQQATTTRYWDCCKPHCGWNSNMKMCDVNGKEISDKNAKSSCEGGPAFQCMDYVPIVVNSKVSYGWAAFNNSGTNCGDCFQLDFQGAMAGKQMIVQIVNIGDGGQSAFDLLIPGGGVGQFKNGCPRQWNNAPMGADRGGFMLTCGPNRDCILGMCQKAFGDKPDLMRGCNWFLDWFKMADNPKVVFKKVACPQAIKNVSRIGN
ncbi:MAG TPA: hypothetical protein VHO70_13150 [Chitinispirillaceae bacterium]|nr:hypothetical protein [Chitinispirillaceae bacterium]